MHGRPPTDEELETRYHAIDQWLHEQMEQNPVVDTVERDVHKPQAWFVRLLGEEKEFSTLWLQLKQRALHVETYFMPAPEENQAELYAHILRRNAKLRGGSFVIGPEDAVYIYCSIDNTLVSLDNLDVELDRVVGSIYQWVEQYFKPALRIGFASRFAG